MPSRASSCPPRSVGRGGPGERVPIAACTQTRIAVQSRGPARVTHSKAAPRAPDRGSYSRQRGRFCSTSGLPRGRALPHWHTPGNNLLQSPAEPSSARRGPAPVPREAAEMTAKRLPRRMRWRKPMSPKHGNKGESVAAGRLRERREQRGRPSPRGCRPRRARFRPSPHPLVSTQTSTREPAATSLACTPPRVSPWGACRAWPVASAAQRVVSRLSAPAAFAPPATPAPRSAPPELKSQAGT